MLRSVAFLGFLFVTAVTGDHPIVLEQEVSEIAEGREVTQRQTVYRLPENVIPLAYDVEIDLNFDETTERAAYSYEGVVSIVLQALEENVTQIVLHANVDQITSLTVLNYEGHPVTLATPPIVQEPLYHFLRINLAESLVPNTNYSLSISYSSTMNEGPLKRGIWRGYYTDANGEVKTYATTHFQPYNARQAFPCWDEPGFKAVFIIHLTRPADYPNVYSNTGIESSDVLPNGRIRDHFQATPKMSSYLVTFLVSESFTVLAEDTTFNPPIRIIGRSNAVGHADLALEMAVKMTEYFDEYFGIPYASMHPNLYNDHISSPDWASAGTENWGMVSYRELYLILDPRETIMSIEHYAATLVSHELAHKWFGNLITCFWWSETWINEGFASYFGYIATAEVFPKYEHDIHFNSRYLQTSLATDSGTGTVPLNNPVNTPAQVTGHFGTISYSKGAAFLRMITDMITPATFRKACQYFLIDNAFEATDQNDLFEAFNRAVIEDGTLTQYANFDFRDFYLTWVNEPGYPILEVDIDYSTGQMSLTQERFFLSATANPTNQIYPIPITYSTQSNPSFTSVKPTSMMTSAGLVLQKPAGEEWVIFNNLQHGHYRVNYNDRNWELIGDALLTDPESIHYLNRAQIVDDVFALMRSERMTYDFGFKILRFLRTETNFHVWNPAISGYTWLRNRLRHIPETQATFDSFVRSYLEHAIEYHGYDVIANETPTTSQNREAILHFACMLSHEGCVNAAQERFNLMRSGTWIDPRIRRSVYVVGIREGGEEAYEFLLNRFLTSNFANDQLEMLRGLGATRDPALLNRFLQMTLTDVIRTQDKVNAFNYALLGNPENADVALEFLMNNIDAIRVAYNSDAPNTPVHTVMSNMAAYLDEEGLARYSNWLTSTQQSTPEVATAISAIQSATNNMQWGTQNADSIIGAARDGAVNTAASILLMTILASLVMNV